MRSGTSYLLFLADELVDNLALTIFLESYIRGFNIQGGPKVSLHTLALIAQSLSAQSK